MPIDVSENAAQSRFANSARWPIMLGLDSVDSVAHVIQVALTPVFLLSGVASLLGVLSTRLGRVADRVDSLAERLETAEPAQREASRPLSRPCFCSSERFGTRPGYLFSSPSGSRFFSPWARSWLS
jgi:hypothetical protein